MAILKRVLIAIGAIIVIALISAAFMKKDFSVEREITINKPKQDVFNYLVLLKNQNDFSKWAKMDPAMKKEFKGEDGTVGFVSAWESDKKDVGKGEQEIKKITPGEKIEYELRFKKPMEMTNFAYLATTSPSPTQTNVKWCFYGTSPWPFNLMGALMDMDKAIGKDLETGLNNLKVIMEK